MEDDDAYIQGLIDKVLFTAPGECVNQPDFGVGLKEFVFAPNTPELMGALESTVQEALNRWLAKFIKVEDVHSAVEETAVRVTIRYFIRHSGQYRCYEFCLYF